MGNRVTVSIRSQEHEAPINIYSHWSGDEIYPVIQDVLQMSDRIGDASYLTAQLIHAVFTQLGYDGKLGFGIWTGDPDEDGWRDNETMYVNADEGKWRIGDEMDWQDRETYISEVFGERY